MTAKRIGFWQEPSFTAAEIPARGLLHVSLGPEPRGGVRQDKSRLKTRDGFQPTPRPAIFGLEMPSISLLFQGPVEILHSDTRDSSQRLACIYPSEGAHAGLGHSTSRAPPGRYLRKEHETPASSHKVNGRQRPSTGCGTDNVGSFARAWEYEDKYFFRTRFAAQVLDSCSQPAWIGTAAKFSDWS